MTDTDPPLPTRIEAMLAIRDEIERFNADPAANIAGPLQRVVETTDDGQVRSQLAGTRLTTAPATAQAPYILADFDTFSAELTCITLVCESLTGTVTRSLAMRDSKNRRLIHAVCRKFAVDGQELYAQMQRFAAEYRARMQPGCYLTTDLYAVGRGIGYNAEDVDLMLYGNDYAVPDELGRRLVALGYTNFYGEDSV